MDSHKIDPPPPYTPTAPQPSGYVNQAPYGYQQYQSPPHPTIAQPYRQYGSTTITIQPQEIVIVGACPVCKIGVLEDDYTCLGILCAIFFFPLGLLCCLLLKNRRCSNCGIYLG